jgi:predicted nucleotidyltransferase
MQPDLRARLTAACGAAPPTVLAVYAFGSEARGDSAPDSDLDIGVLFTDVPGSTLMGEALSLEGDLERTLGRQVDLVVLNTAPADLVHRVLRDGVLVLDRDRSARIRFEVARRNEFFDLQPILETYRRPSVRTGP